MPARCGMTKRISTRLRVATFGVVFLGAAVFLVPTSIGVGFVIGSALTGLLIILFAMSCASLRRLRGPESLATPYRGPAAVRAFARRPLGCRRQSRLRGGARRHHSTAGLADWRRGLHVHADATRRCAYQGGLLEGLTCRRLRRGRGRYLDLEVSAKERLLATACLRAAE